MLITKTKFRAACESELSALKNLQAEAFGQDEEGELTERLIKCAAPTFSLVAEYDHKLIGHVLYTEISAPIKAVQLAPLGVLSDFRDMQIGSELVRRGNQLMERSGYDAIFVLGDTNYYERFGFSSTSADRYQSQYQCPSFMVIEFKHVPKTAKSMKLIYPSPFNA